MRHLPQPALRRLALVLVLAVNAAPVTAQCFSESFSSDDLTGQPFAQLTSVDVDGPWAVIGGALGDAIFLEYTASGWENRDHFPVGFVLFYPPAVAIDGTRVVVGVSEADGGPGITSGFADVFELGPTGWQQTQRLVPSDADTYDFFGASVALDGDTIVVGAPHYGAGFGDVDAALYVFELSGGSWTETQKLQPGVWHGGFGLHAALDGDVLVAGDPSDIPGGAAVVFERQAGAFAETARLKPSTPNSNAQLGSRVDVDGDRIVVGSLSVTTVPGAAYIFDRAGTDWTETQPIIPSDSSTSDTFGKVSLQGDRLLAAGRWAVYLFEESGGVWSESWSLPNPDPGDCFGNQVALSDTYAFVIGSESFRRVYAVDLGIEGTDTFCPPPPSSTLFPAELDVQGCDSVGGNSLSFVAAPVPNNAIGALLFATNTTQVPFGNGTLCVAAPFFRATPVAESGMQLSLPLDLDTPPGDVLQPGTTWNFQAAFRDVAGGGFGFTTSAARLVTMTP